MTRLPTARRLRCVRLTLALLAALTLPAAAGATPIDPRLTERLDPETAAAVGDLVEEARAKGLPADALVARALEGASRQAPGPRIVAALRNLTAALESSRAMLGNASTAAELVAGAAALAAGVPADTLARLRAARANASLVVPLVVLTDLVTRRVPIETAGAAVIAATRNRVRDAELMKLRQRIDQDIRGGASPGGATILRTRRLIGAYQGPAGTPAPPGRSPAAGP